MDKDANSISIKEQASAGTPAWFVLASWLKVGRHHRRIA